jgi:hypothetical protein
LASALAAVMLIAALAVASAIEQAGPSTPARQNVAAAIRASRAASLSRLRLLPTQAQSVISTALGSGEAVFAPRRSGDGYRISGGGVLADLNGNGALFGAGRESLSMALGGVGRGGRVNPVGSASSSVRANRVSYDHARAGLREWYAAGPLGIEQGFTLARRPSGRGPLTLALSLGGSLSAQTAGSSSGVGSDTAPGASQIFFRTASGRLALRYGGLSVLDARGRKLPATLSLHGHSLLLHISDRGARYPLRIDPFAQQGEKLVGDCTERCEGPNGTGEKGNGNFGWSVALSAEGDTALIGAPTDSEQGAAWVFTRAGSTWSQQGPKLTGSGEEGQGAFGWSVALSADGNTALIGGLHDRSDSGAAWVFTRSGTTWSQQGPKLMGSGEEGPGSFGESVALSPNGNTALVGGPSDRGSGGAAWVFSRSGSAWKQQGEKLTGTGEVGEGQFGESLALSSDGNTALIGGPHDSSGQGAAWVFTRSGETWAQQGDKLTSGLCSPAEFGASVALSADGGSALVGGPLYSLGQGAVWLFSRSGGTWSQQGEKLTAGGEVGAGHFGESVALSATNEGDLALIGGSHDNSLAGAAWVFWRSPEGAWIQQGEKLTGGGSEAGQGRFGESVALSFGKEGDTALVGGYSDNGAKGAAWVFHNSSAPTTTTTSTPPTTSTSSECPTTTTTSTARTTSTSTPTTTSTATIAAPILAGVAQSHKVWREPGKLASTGRKAHNARRPRKPPPLGTNFSFSLNEQASVGFTFDELLPGRRVSHKCVAPTSRNAKHGACKRTAVAGTLSYAGHAGENRLAFRGHISGPRWLKAGSYTVAITATNEVGERSRAAHLSFTVVRY